MLPQALFLLQAGHADVVGGVHAEQHPLFGRQGGHLPGLVLSQTHSVPALVLEGVQPELRRIGGDVQAVLVAHAGKSCRPCRRGQSGCEAVSQQFSSFVVVGLPVAALPLALEAHLRPQVGGPGAPPSGPGCRRGRRPGGLRTAGPPPSPSAAGTPPDGGGPPSAQRAGAWPSGRYTQGPGGAQRVPRGGGKPLDTSVRPTPACRMASSQAATSALSSWLRSPVRVLSISSTRARTPFCARKAGVMWVTS